MSDIVIASAVRTPIGAFNGAFAGLTAHQLGTVAVDAALSDYGHSPRQIMGWLAAREYAACFYDGRRHMMVHAADIVWPDAAR